MNYIALVEINEIGVHILERHHALLLLQKYGLRTRVLHAILDIGHETITVVRRDNFGLGEVRGNFLWDTKLININVGIGRNHRTGREVDALAHKVTAHTTRLRTETGLQGLEWATGPLSSRGHTLNIVVHIRRHIILEKFRMLLNVLAGLTGGNQFTELLVATNDVDENVGEIVIHTLIILHYNRGAHGQGRNSENRTYHPRRVGELGIKAQNLDRIICHALEATQDHLGLQGYDGLLLASKLALESAHCSLNLLHFLDNLSPAGRAGWLSLLCEFAEVINRALANIGQTIHTLELGVQVNLLRETLLSSDIECRAVHADAVEGLDGELEKLVEVNWTCKGNMSEMALALKIRMFAGGADFTTLDNTQTCIKDTSWNRIISLMSLISNYFHH